MIYKTLETTNIETLHETFIKAFSDYQVKMDLPLWKFQQMLQRRGYVPEVSIGAFNEKILVGFILNGLRNWRGISTAYDLGTGVIGEYRKLGITSNLFSNIKKLLQSKEVGQYLLEVIKSNTPAIQLYKKNGFETIRDLECFQLVKNNYNPMTKYKVEYVDKFDSVYWNKFIKFWDIVPSWQNSIDSINAVPDIFEYSIVRIDDNIVGYGIIDKKTGDIPQLAVNKSYRCKGIAKSIITSLQENTDSHKVSILNIDIQSKRIKDILLKLGFKYYVGQYELILTL